MSRGHALDTATLTNNVIRGRFTPCFGGICPAAFRIQGTNMDDISGVVLSGNRVEDFGANSSVMETFGNPHVEIEGNVVP